MRRPRFKVTITETLKRTVEVEAADQHEAEQMVYDAGTTSNTFLTLMILLTWNLKRCLS